MMDTREKIPLETFQARLRMQEVSGREHFALRCVVCGTVQSIASFKAVGIDEEKAETLVGFSCIGRVTNAGPYKKDGPKGIGCDWTLGGLFRLHELEIVTADGKTHPMFSIATSDEAKDLEARLTAGSTAA